MTEAPSKHRLPAWAQWCIVCLGVPVTVCALPLALSSFLEGEWPLPIVLLFGLLAPGAVVGLVVVLLIFGRYLVCAVAVAEMTILAWFASYFSLELGKTTMSEFLDLLAFTLVLLLILALPFGFAVSLKVAITEWRKSSVRAAYPLLVYLVLAILIWLVPIGGVIPIPSGHSDAAMEAHFHQHREHFDQLVALITKEDYMMSRVAIRIADGSPHPVQARWNLYRSLFREMGLSEGLERSEDGTIHLSYWEHRPLTGVWRERGYAYSKRQLAPIVASLDEIATDVARTQCVYRKISEYWYIYDEWRDSLPDPCE